MGAKRTAFGTYGGKFVKTSACDLQTVAAKAALASANVKPELVDTVTIGNVLSVSSFYSILCNYLFLTVSVEFIIRWYIGCSTCFTQKWNSY